MTKIMTAIKTPHANHTTVVAMYLCLVVFPIINGCQYKCQDDFEKKARCIDVGKIYYEKTIVGLGKDASIYKITYEVAYNKKFDTCLYYAETTFKNGNKNNAYIRDLFGNKNLYFMSYGGGGEVLIGASSFKTEQEFIDKYKELIMIDKK